MDKVFNFFSKIKKFKNPKKKNGHAPYIVLSLKTTKKY